MMDRNSFLKKFGLLGLGLAGCQAQGSFPLSRHEVRRTALIPIFPQTGDVLHEGDGKISSEGITVQVQVYADLAAFSEIFINGQRACGQGGLFTAPVTLKPGENRIVVGDTTEAHLLIIPVLYAPRLFGGYRLSVDDAIWFLRDINDHQPRFKSIFDHPYLGGLKSLHDRYGVKVHLNLFYQTPGFTLSDMTDRYKSEWLSHASWLRLSVHALEEFPDDPYKHSDYQTIYGHATLIRREIARFAGEQLMDATTTLHWGEVPVEVCRGLRDVGYDHLVCDFNVDNALPPCSYYLSIPQRRHLQQRFLWKDYQEKLVFLKSSVIIDTLPHSGLVPHLDTYMREGRRPPYVDLLVHEQYFYDDYANFQPDYMDKLEVCVQWAVRHGYKPSFLSESLSVY